MALPILDGNQSATTLSTILTGGAHIPAHTVVSLGSQAITDFRNAVSGSVVSVPVLPAISGTVMLLGSNGDPIDQGAYIPVGGLEGNPVAISGTVTANVAGNLNGAIEIVTDTENVSHSVAVKIYDAGGSQVGTANNPLPIGGTVTVGSCVTHGVTIANSSVTVNGTFWQATQPVSLASLPATTVTVSSLPAISGTVTANVASTTVTVSALPSGALTTRFGSVTTANTAQITTAVTNASRKYLLAQNISAGTVTIGIGFSPTTTQGIQLTAGAGLTFDAFCPTGAVYWLGATTGATWTILEG